MPGEELAGHLAVDAPAQVAERVLEHVRVAARRRRLRERGHEAGRVAGEQVGVRRALRLGDEAAQRAVLRLRVREELELVSGVERHELPAREAAREQRRSRS